MKKLLSENFELHTERLFLRPLRVSDAETIWPYTSDPEIPKYMCWNVHEHIETTKKFLQQCVENFKKESVTWGILKDSKFCGLISLEFIRKIHDVPLERAELGYWLGKEFWGMGIALEAAREVIKFAFEHLRIHKVTIGHFVENIRSERVIQKLGFRYVGEQKAHFFKDEKWHDQKCYEMLKEEFLKSP